jgi:hypothetical protein
MARKARETDHVDAYRSCIYGRARETAKKPLPYVPDNERWAGANIKCRIDTETHQRKSNAEKTEQANHLERRVQFIRQPLPVYKCGPRSLSEHRRLPAFKTNSSFAEVCPSIDDAAA